jgi:hypothetical protein
MESRDPTGSKGKARSFELPLALRIAVQVWAGSTEARSLFSLTPTHLTRALLLRAKHCSEAPPRKKQILPMSTFTGFAPCQRLVSELVGAKHCSARELVALNNRLDGALSFCLARWR